MQSTVSKKCIYSKVPMCKMILEKSSIKMYDTVGIWYHSSDKVGII